jgi:Tfp pilus assembly protein PilO
MSEGPPSPDPLRRFRDGSAFAWIAICLLLLATIFGVGYAFYPEGEALQLTQLPR